MTAEAEWSCAVLHRVDVGVKRTRCGVTPSTEHDDHFDSQERVGASVTQSAASMLEKSREGLSAMVVCVLTGNAFEMCAMTQFRRCGLRIVKSWFAKVVTKRLGALSARAPVNLECAGKSRSLDRIVRRKTTGMYLNLWRLGWKYGRNQAKRGVFPMAFFEYMYTNPYTFFD